MISCMKQNVLLLCVCDVVSSILLYVYWPACLRYSLTESGATLRGTPVKDIRFLSRPSSMRVNFCIFLLLHFRTVASPNFPVYLLFVVSTKEKSNQQRLLFKLAEGVIATDRNKQH